MKKEKRLAVMEATAGRYAELDKREISGHSGMCAYLGSLGSFYCSNLIKVAFPELEKYNPKKDYPWWFRRDTNGLCSRIAVLLCAIDDLKNSK